MNSTDVFLQALVSGLLSGWLYALVAIGLTLMFGVMRVVNFAHGEFLMLAMYGAFLAYSMLGVNPAISVLWMLPFMGLIGAVFYKLIIRHLAGKSELASMAVTLGVGMLLQNLALMVFKADNLVADTSWANQALQVGYVSIQLTHASAAVASIVLIGALYALLRFTDLGIMMRAVSQSAEGAALSGINSHRIAMWTTVIGIATLGVAGPMLVSILYVNPTVGVQFTLIAFVTVIAGGLGNFFGAVVSGILVGVTERVASIWLPGSVAAAIPFCLLVIVMLWRPEGLLVPRKSA
ncbi:MAG: branched-chain amino acid ABC transporter permease [Burkholderiales bacterium]